MGVFMATDIYLEALQKAGVSPEDSVLAVCAGSCDQRALQAAGVKNAVISNVNHHAGVSDYAPYAWQYQDAEEIKSEDGCFDWCIVHNGLHHCGSPHRALCEMLRVSRKGVVLIEARDSLLMRFAVVLGLTPTFELEPVFLTEGAYGGLRNSQVPNFVYRWTEREIWKTVCSAEPHRVPSIQYLYGYRIPTERLTMSKSATKRVIAHVANAMVGLLKLIAPRQGNTFGAVICKNGAIQPWLLEDHGKLVADLDYMSRLFAREKYVKGG
jgi:ubiquinone/menaquinone biosynthesis C-methylase UbiE